MVMLDQLRTFISFRSVGKDTAAKTACLDWILKEFLSASGVTPVRGDVKGAPYIFLRHNHPKLLWFGHTDVVPGRDDQFTVKIEGDHALGRGVKDMKGADLAFLIAYRDACTSGHIPPVSVLLTSDEETGGHTPEVLLDQKILGEIPVAFTPDTGEADGIVTELKGALWARLVASGSSGHAATPWKSCNPVPLLVDALKILAEKYPSGSETDWGVTVTPTQLRGSDAFNRIPDSASCILDIRFPPTIWKNTAEAAREISQHLPSDCHLEEVEHADPTFCNAKHPMVLTLKRIAEEVEGKSVPILREHGASDARFFTAHGIPAFLYGPVGGDLHGANEWVSIPSLERQVEVNRRWLEQLNSQEK